MPKAECDNSSGSPHERYDGLCEDGSTKAVDEVETDDSLATDDQCEDGGPLVGPLHITYHSYLMINTIVCSSAKVVAEEKALQKGRGVLAKAKADEQTHAVVTVRLWNALATMDIADRNII